MTSVYGDCLLSWPSWHTHTIVMLTPSHTHVYSKDGDFTRTYSARTRAHTHTHTHKHTHTLTLKLVKSDLVVLIKYILNFTLFLFAVLLRSIQVLHYMLHLFDLLCISLLILFWPISSKYELTETPWWAGMVVRLLAERSVIRILTEMICLYLSIVRPDPVTFTAYPVRFSKTCVMPA